MLVRRAQMLPLECIVRGYLSGSAWAEYKRSGTMHGTALPAGMLQSQQLPEPVFTPSTKATVGHDENISFDQAAALVGAQLASAAREICVEAYRAGAARAAERGIIIADTKFELGLIDGELAICDEVLTPDSSRFWPVAQWRPGGAPPSFDKQPLRDWLDESGWDKRPPPPALPPEVVEATRSRYIAAYELLTGLSFADWPGSEAGPGPGPGSAGERLMAIFEALVEVQLRPGISDPQGATIERALPALGFAGVSGVRAGKAFRLQVEAAERGRGPPGGRGTVLSSAGQPRYRGHRRLHHGQRP